MDFHMQSNPRLHYGLNGCHQSSHSDDGLQFLSMEEQEIIHFLDKTISSLEKGLEEENTELSSERVVPVEDLRTATAVSPIAMTPVSPNLIEHDIIDLVRTTSDFSMPDFQSLVIAPEAHFETPPRRDPTVVPEESSHLPPPGSIPTPAVIASKIAEHQGAGGPSTLPSVLLERRQSLESPCSPPPKHGPPTHAKPTRLPDNINTMLATRDPSPQSIAQEAINAQERRSQMLANLPASVHPLEGGEPACVRNLPTRSVSFSDPAPDKSRMEALSKLGLTKGKTTQVMVTPMTATKMESSTNRIGTSTSVTSNSDHTTNIINTSNSGSDVPTGLKKTDSITVAPYSHSTRYEPKNKNDISAHNFNSSGGKQPIITPATTEPVYTANSLRRSSASLPLRSDFNSYGGKTIVLNPAVSFKSEPGSGNNAKLEHSEILLNSYGGRSRVIHPSMPTDLPDGTASRPRSHSHSPSSMVTSPTHCGDLHSPIGVKSKIFPPSKTDTQRTSLQSNLLSHDAGPTAVTSSHPDQVRSPIIRRATAPPTLSPRPQHPTGSMTASRPQADSNSQEFRKPAPKASFRTQGITVQFSGKGATDEARRDALRKLGLLKNTL